MQTIHCFDLSKELERGNVHLIDVREPAERRSEFIPGSTHIPLAAISGKDLEQKKTAVIYCASGRRSAEACKKLLKANPHLTVRSLEGGLSSWKTAGLLTEINSSSQILPLDRQTQLAAGALAFTGVVLGFSVNNAFFILPGFVGAGLLLAGSTGWCGMAKLLAKMPWNK